MTPVLLGNSFPLSLIRRPVRIEPRPLEELREAVADRGVVSFWGHANTLTAARQILGFDPAPAVQRPAVSLSAAQRPVLDGQEFEEVWVLSPDYRTGFRPELGREVPMEALLGWQVLRISF
jgi:hypothetical protein